MNESKMGTMSVDHCKDIYSLDSITSGKILCGFYFTKNKK